MLVTYEVTFTKARNSHAPVELGTPLARLNGDGWADTCPRPESPTHRRPVAAMVLSPRHRPKTQGCMIPASSPRERRSRSPGERNWDLRLEDMIAATPQPLARAEASESDGCRRLEPAS